jgi:hypothetical protein
VLFLILFYISKLGVGRSVGGREGRWTFFILFFRSEGGRRRGGLFVSRTHMVSVSVSVFTNQPTNHIFCFSLLGVSVMVGWAGIFKKATHDDDDAPPTLPAYLELMAGAELRPPGSLSYTYTLVSKLVFLPLPSCGWSNVVLGVGNLCWIMRGIM